MPQFITHNKVRMHDTDMVGILYFPRQFRFVHDALEDMLETADMNFTKILTQEEFVFVIVHAESDYFSPLHVGDSIEVHVTCEHIGTTSFILNYQIYKTDKTHVGQSKTVHVCLEAKGRTKIPVPPKIRSFLTKFLEQAS